MILQSGLGLLALLQLYVVPRVNEHIHSHETMNAALWPSEEAEKKIKAAADDMNKQLPKEAQAGSLQPLTEEKGEKGKKGGQQEDEQILDTFSVEIDALDQVCPSYVILS